MFCVDSLFEDWKLENGKWKMENGKWKMENGKWKMENGKWKMENSCALLCKYLGFKQKNAKAAKTRLTAAAILAGRLGVLKFSNSQILKFSNSQILKFWRGNFDIKKTPAEKSTDVLFESIILATSKKLVPRSEADGSSLLYRRNDWIENRQTQSLTSVCEPTKLRLNTCLDRDRGHDLYCPLAFPRSVHRWSAKG